MDLLLARLFWQPSTPSASSSDKGRSGCWPGTAAVADKEVEEAEAEAQASRKRTASAESAGSAAARKDLPLELDNIPQSSSHRSVTGSLPSMAVRAVSTTMGLAGFGVGYGMGKLFGTEGKVSDSASFRRGCEACLSAQGIFPEVFCECDQSQQVSRIENDEEGQTELWRSTPIIVSNHMSYIDTMVLPIVCKMPKFMSMAEVKNWPLFGQVGEDLDYIWVDRSSGDARKAALEAVENHCRQWQYGDRPLLMFPEGTTSNGDGLHPFKKGAFISGAPVRPVLITYTGSWNPANVNFREESAQSSGTPAPSVETALPVTPRERSQDGNYVPYGDGEWAMQFAGHLVHKCTVLVCRRYDPSQEEKADPELYASNVRKLMLKKLKELQKVCRLYQSST